MPQNNVSDAERLESPNVLQLGKLDSRHKEIMRREIMGESNNSIARDMGINIARLSVIMRSSLYLAEKLKLEDSIKARFESVVSKENLVDTRELLNNESAEAAKGVIELMRDAQSEPVRLKSMLEILNRTGFTSLEKPTTVVNVVVSQEQENDSLEAKAISENELGTKNRLETTFDSLTQDTPELKP